MFRHKVPAIKVARDRLLDLPVEQARTGALVLGGLRRACELADVYKRQILKRKWAHGTGNFSPNVCRVEPVHIRFRGRVGQEQLRAVALSRMISFLPSRRSARRKRAVSGTGQGLSLIHI